MPAMTFTCATGRTAEDRQSSLLQQHWYQLKGRHRQGHQHEACWVQEWDGGDSPGVRDVFDFPDEEPSELFINPFACAIDPFMWRELQVCCACG